MEIIVSGFNELGQALDQNAEVIKIINGQATHVLKEAQVEEPDKLKAVLVVDNA